jgi:two-component sensor histidine kinase
MSGSIALVQPILVDVAADGTLVRADGPALRLHLMAGGEEHGQLAIPALAALASATHKFRMRLARTVKVADEDEDIDLWIETEIIDSIARLKIIGWRSNKKNDEVTAREEPLDHIDGMIELLFNQQLLLVSVSGDGGNNSICIGKSSDEIFTSDDDDDNIKTRAALLHHLPIHTGIVSVVGGDCLYAVTGFPKHDRQNLFIGYACQLRPIARDEITDSVNQDNSAPLFGLQLGSALRQPLGRIIANAETIGSKLQGPIRDSYATYAKDIADAARHLVTIVDDLGDLEAIERAGFSTANDTIELGDIARRVAGLLALKAADHSISILAPSAVPTVPATAEFRRVLQILINLVTNAIYYAPDGTRVTIAISQDSAFAQISVSDQGSGVPEADREKIFNKFERLGRSNDGGSGLGLYISRRLARAMRGDLIVEAAEQGGAKFTLTLPV